VLDVVVEAEAAVAEIDVARVVPVGDVDVVLGQHGAHCVTQQGREVARERRHQQHARPRRLDVLLEMQQRAERRDSLAHLAHRYLAVADRHPVDAERRAYVGEPRARDQLVGGGEIAQRARRECRPRRGFAERVERCAGEDAHQAHDVGMGLVGLVKHLPPARMPAPSPNQPRRRKASGFDAALREKIVAGRRRSGDNRVPG